MLSSIKGLDLSATNRKEKFFLLSTIAVLTVLAYKNSFHGSFVFDDEAGILSNEAIKSFGNIKSLLFYNLELARPLFNLSLAFNWAFSQDNTFTYHLFNFVLHLANVYLVWALGAFLVKDDASSSRRYAPYLGAAIFAVHPVCTESVSYIWSRPVLMMSVFYLGALLVFVKASGRQKITTTDSLAFVGLFVLALASKEEAMTLIVAVVMIEALCFQSKSRSSRFYKLHLPLWIIMLSLILLRTALGLSLFDAVSWRETFSDEYSAALSGHGLFGMAAINLLTQFKVTLLYFKLLVLPFGFNVDHLVRLVKSPFDPWVIFGVSGIIAGLSLAFVMSRKEKAYGVAAALFIAPLLVFFVVPLADIMVERRAYLPCAGWAMALSVIIVRSLEPSGKQRWPWDRESRQVIVALSAIIMLACFIYLAHERNRVWSSNLFLWRDAHFKSPEKLRPRVNLAMAYFEAGMDFRAEAENVEALKNTPHYNEALRNLGVVYMKQGRLKFARRYFGLAVHFKPKSDYKAYFNMGVLEEKEGNLDEAQRHYLKAIEIEPDFALAYANLGTMSGRKGRQDKAFGYLEKAIELAPSYYKPHMDMGLLYMNSKFYPEARKSFEKALKLAPKAPLVHYNMGGLFITMNDPLTAEAYFREAVKLNSNFTPAHMALAKALGASGKISHAKAQLELTIKVARENGQTEIEMQAKEFLNRLGR